MDKYRILQVIGEGTYGKVFKAQEKETGRVVAIKKFKQKEDEDPHVRKTMMREIRILREYRHTNIVNLREVFREKGKLYLIFDYVQKTLLEELQGTPDGLDFERIKSITYQIIQANNFLHEGKIIHRDIKPENLLISKSGVVKLCDFGFARPLNSSANYQYTDYVSTRWYRAPELLVGDAAYSGTVDVWAIGCIFAEIFNGMPLFPGDSDMHTLQLILETITADDMDNDKPIQELSKKQRVAFRMNPMFENQKVPLASESIKTPETVNEVSLRALLKNINETQLDFVRRCLVIDGGTRANLAELLVHPVFDEEFRASHDAKMQEMTEKDEIQMQELMKEQLMTKDGRPELSPDELVTEDEQKEDDDEDEFDDDDSSSAVDTGGSSSGVTPQSSSGVEHSKQYHTRNEQNKKQGDSFNQDEGSIKTAAPHVGDGLLPNASNANSIGNLLVQNASMVSADESHGNNPPPETSSMSGAVKNSPSAQSVDVQSKVLLMSSKKKFENAPSGASGTPSQEQQQTSAMQILTSVVAHHPDGLQHTESVKEVKDLRDSQEQLHITKGVNGTTSLQSMPNSQDPKTLESQFMGDATSQESEPHQMEPKKIFVNMQGSSVQDYYGNEPVVLVAAVMSTQDANQPNGQQHTRAQKRTSLNHYMIESSITEDVKEENYSEKTSSEKTSHQGTPGQNIERADHVIVQEGVTSMFQHSGSRLDTDNASSRITPQQEQSAVAHDQDEVNKNQIKGSLSSAESLAQIKLGAQNISNDTKNNKNGKSAHETTYANSMTETKATSDPKSSEFRGAETSLPASSINEGPMSRAATLGGIVSNMAGSQGFAVHSNSNPIAFMQQNSEDQTRYSSNGQQMFNQSMQQQQQQLPGSTNSKQLSTAKAQSGAPPQISKVNITFGSGQTQSNQQQQQSVGSKAGLNSSSINLQVNGTSAADIASRQSSLNNTGSGGIQLNVGVASQDSNAQQQAFANLNSSRAVVNSNGVSVNRSSISLKQISGATGVNQTARDFTPSAKQALIGPSPQSTIQQKQLGGVESSGLKQLYSNGLDSTAAKTTSIGGMGAIGNSQSNNKQQSNSQHQQRMAQQDMLVSQFSGKPIYSLQQYPQTQVKGPGPKQAAILKQTSSVEKFNPNRDNSPQKLPNLKPINSSMSQYGHAQMNNFGKKPTTSEDSRVGEGLVNIHAQNNRKGLNSITGQFSSQQQQPRYGGGPQINQQITGNKLASGSTQSLKTKMNFTSQNYHRASNSQTNEPNKLTKNGVKQASTTIANSIAANSAKKSQMIQPLKLVAFPTLMNEDSNQMATASPTAISQGLTQMSQAAVGHAPTLSNTLANQKQKNGGNQSINNGLLAKGNSNSLQKKGPQTLMVQQQQQLSSKTQASKMPKRYSDMGMVHNSKFANIQANGQPAPATGDINPTFHPTLTNEYMLSQESLVLNEGNSKPSRQSSENLDKPKAINGSVETRHPRNQVTSHISSNQKSRTTGHQVVNQNPNQSLHSTMKSKNSKFIHQNNNQGKNNGFSVNSSGALAMSKVVNRAQQIINPPQTQEKQTHQHFLEEFNEASSQRQSITRSNVAQEANTMVQGTSAKTPMTSLFQKSKFFQSTSSNAENNPNTMNAPAVQPNSNHYGGQYMQSMSPNRHQGQSKGQDQNMAVISNFTDKDSFPRRNITNKLRNANNIPQQKRHQQKLNSDIKGASGASSPSPISFYKNHQNNVVLPNLSNSGSNPAGYTVPQGGFNHHNQQQQQIMQVSLTQLRTTATDNRNGNSVHLSQSPNIKSSKKSDQTAQLGTQKLSVAANVVQLNASEFNLRLTNNSQLSGGGTKNQVPYQQIVRKAPGVIAPGRAQQYQMYLTPSQNYTSGTQGSLMGKGAKSIHAQKSKPLAQVGNGSSPSNLNSKKGNDIHSFQVQKMHPMGQGVKARSPGFNGGIPSYKVKTETDWHRGSQQQLFEMSNMAQPNQLYRVSNQFLEKSISPQRIQQAMKRGSNAQMLSSQGGGMALVGGPANNYTESKMNLANQSKRRPPVGPKSDVDPVTLGSNGGSSGMIKDSSQDSLPITSPNLLRKKFISKQQNQIK